MHTGFALTGSMEIEMKNVFMRLPDGFWWPLLPFDALSLGKIGTNGANMSIDYSLGVP